MKELICVTVLTLVAYVVSQFLSIENAALESLVNSIPIIIPTFIMWSRVPKNYLKFMCFRSFNIRYKIDIKIDNCKISDIHFKQIRRNLLDLDQSKAEKILNESFGDIIYTSSIEVDASIIELKYYIDNESLIIQSRSKVKYKLFFRMAESLLHQVNLVFTNNKDICYSSNDISIKVRIEFIGKNKTDAKNPFWEKLFYGFKHKIVYFKYMTKNNTSVTIDTDIIEFIGKNIKDINEDIKNELTLFRFRN